jgi:hypothetical protein
MIPEACPRCGGPIQFLDKDTSTGRDVVTYGCEACPWNESFDLGIAMWRALSDSDEQTGTQRDREHEGGSPAGSRAEDRTLASATDDSRGPAAPEKLSDVERQAFLDGYNDCVLYRHIPFGYKPTAGYEEAYREGWFARMQEEDEQRLREWTGLP